MTKRETAIANFKKGYNCSQSILLAFADELGIDEKTALMISSPFGGGMGRMREVCGSVSGMLMVAGMKYGYYIPGDREGKTELYKRVQELAGKFREKNGSIVCRELLGLEGRDNSPIPSERTEQYYKKRPCPELIGDAAEILEKYLSENQQ